MSPCAGSSPSRGEERGLFVQAWPEPVVVIGAAAAAAGEIVIPPEIAGEVVLAPFASADRFLAERAPGAAALVAAIGRLMGQPGMGTLPAPERRGIVIGTWAAALSEVRDFMAEVDAVGGNLVNPGLFPFTVINAAAGRAAIEHRCEGPNLTLNNGPTSALDAVAYAADLAASGRSQVVFAGGFEGVSEHFGQAFGRRRGGVAAAAVLALATARAAAAAGARPLARLLSFCSARGAGGGGQEALRREALAAALGRAREIEGGGSRAGQGVDAGEVPAPCGAPEPDAMLLSLLQAVRLAAAGGAGLLVPILAEAAAPGSVAVLVLGSPCGGGRLPHG